MENGEETVFTLENLIEAALKCLKGVMWKESVQQFKLNLVERCARLERAIRNGTYRITPLDAFDVIDGGKIRHVQPIYIDDRAVQRVICDKVLWPHIGPRLISDNYACQKGKGMSLALKRLKKHLSEHYRKYGKAGYVLKMDFKEYFANIDQEKLFSMLDWVDERSFSILKDVITTINKKGLDLGSQVSQTLALFYASDIDHLVKERLHIRHYGRYMDDSYLLAETKEELEHCLEKIEEECSKLGITLNTRKTKMMKLDRGFSFLKKRASFGKNGKILLRPDPKSAKKGRKKIRKLKEMDISAEDIEASFKSTLGYMENFPCDQARRGYIKAYKEQA